MDIVVERGEAVDCKQLASVLGLELVPANVEGVRSKAKRLAARGWLAKGVRGCSAASLPAHAEAHLIWSAITLMLRRLTRPAGRQHTLADLIACAA